MPNLEDMIFAPKNVFYWRPGVKKNSKKGKTRKKQNCKMTFAPKIVFY